jgi:hypothetical protein
VDTSLEDVYFATLHRLRSAGTAGAPSETAAAATPA